MNRYIALVDCADGAYGASYPDLPGCTAMGRTLDELWTHSVEALTAWIEATEAANEPVAAPRSLEEIFADEEIRVAIRDGAVTMATPVVREAPRPVRVNMSIDAGLLVLIDATAERVNMTRSGLVEALARRHLAEFN